MKKQFSVVDAKFIFSKNKLAYQEVLTDIPNAKEVTIITYNISEKQSKLIDFLQSAPSSCEVNIVTNIPGRWDKYC